MEKKWVYLFKKVALQLIRGKGSNLAEMNDINVQF